MNDKPGSECAESAGEWHDRLRAGTLTQQEREQFTCWLKDSPDHVEAYLMVSSIYAQLKQVLGNQTPSERHIFASKLD